MRGFALRTKSQRHHPAQNAAPNAGAEGGQGENPDFSKIFKGDKEKISYAIGMWASGNLKRALSQLKHDDIEIDQDVLFKAFKDNLSGAPTLVTEAFRT